MTIKKEQQIELNLVKASIKGNRRALEKLIRKYINFCYSISLVLTGNKKLALLATKKTLNEIYNSISYISKANIFKIWLYNTLKNNIQKIQEKNYNSFKIENKIFFDDIDKTLAIQENLFQELMHLPKEQREIIALVDFEGLDCEEVADILDEPVLDIRTKLYNAKIALYNKFFLEKERIL